MNFEEQTGWKDGAVWAEGDGGFRLLKDGLRSVACAAGYVVGPLTQTGEEIGLWGQTFMVPVVPELSLRSQ